MRLLKPFRVRDLTKACLIVGLLMNAHQPYAYGAMALHLKYTCQRFETLCTLTGLGLFTPARLSVARSLKIERLRAMYAKASLPLDLN